MVNRRSARLRLGCNAWSTNRYLKIELPKGQQMKGICHCIPPFTDSSSLSL